MVVLDNVEKIEKLDKSNMSQLLHEFPTQGEKVLSLMKNFPLLSQEGKIGNVIISGLGGSAIGGDILKGLLRDSLPAPVVVNRSYGVPGWVSERSLMICVSYSGNTEETLSSYEAGKKRGARLAVVSSDGKLTELAQKDGIPYLAIPGGAPPRTALGYLFFPCLLILNIFGIVSVEEREIREAVETLISLRREIDLSAPIKANLAKQLAEQLYGTLPLIYTTSDFLEGVGMRWKTQLNENSKIPAYYQSFPELDHNEIMGWEGLKDVCQKMALVLLRDQDESERMQKRIEITKKIISSKVGKMLEVHSRGENLLSRILSLVYIGDYISFYLAILNEKDPTEIVSITRLKELMANS